MPKNKVKFGLRKCSYALVTMTRDETSGAYTVSFGNPVAMPGAVSLSLTAEGDTSNFYADDSVYYVLNSNAGYSGDLELALIPESFLADVLKETEDANGVLIENQDVATQYFALLFEFSGDQKKIRHVMYYCSAARPGIEGKTMEDRKEVKTETLSITAAPLPECTISGTLFSDGLVKSKTGSNTTDAVYNAWYSAVYVPSSAAAVESATGNSGYSNGGEPVDPGES